MVTKIVMFNAGIVAILSSGVSGCSENADLRAVQSQGNPQLTLIEQYPNPVITVNSPGAEGVTYGFEGGQVVKIGDTYHLITAEFIQNPLDPPARFTRTNIAHWTSTNRVDWQRIGTLLASTGDRSGTDPRAVYAGAMPKYNRQTQRWEFFCVAYRSQPDDAPYPPSPGRTDPNPFLFPVNVNFTRNPHTYYEYSGRILRFASETSGTEGIGGPYREIQTVMETGLHSQPWEGLFGDDSFEPYQVGREWFALYGSAHTEGSSNSPYSGRLMVGLASSSSLNGPWVRQSENPLNIEPLALENPIVFFCPNGVLIALYNAPGWPTFDVGYTASTDGVHWSEGKHLTVQPQGSDHWAATIRTPLGLVLESDGTFAIFYTGTSSLDAWSDSYHMSVGYVTVKLDFSSPP